ncbi:MAG: hypothetical protein AAF354_01890 [Pseudomonadota bacterium]
MLNVQVHLQKTAVAKVAAGILNQALAAYERALEIEKLMSEASHEEVV